MTTMALAANISVIYFQSGSKFKRYCLLFCRLQCVVVGMRCLIWGIFGSLCNYTARYKRQPHNQKITY